MPGTKLHYRRFRTAFVKDTWPYLEI